MDIKSISDNIKKFREVKSYTREYIADELKMSVSGYSKIERGEIDLTISKVTRISNLLGVSPSQILDVDAANIFNVSDNQNPTVQGTNGSVVNNYADDSTKKYIAVLERENERLRSIIE